MLDVTWTDTQVQILDAALGIITEDGVRGASMRKVAERAEVSLGLLSYHFDDKQELITSACSLACTRLMEASEAALPVDDADPAERVRSFVAGPFTEEFLEPDYLALRISIWAVARTDEEIGEIERTYYLRYVDRLAELLLMANDDLAPKVARATAVDVSAMQNGLWLDYARYRDDESLERGIARCQDLAAEALS